jgi:hypothetical protein
MAAIAIALQRGNVGSEIWEQSPSQTNWTGVYRMFDSTSFGTDENLHWRPTGKIYGISVFDEVVRSIVDEIRASA